MSFYTLAIYYFSLLILNLLLRTVHKLFIRFRWSFIYIIEHRTPGSSLLCFLLLLSSVAGTTVA